DPTSNQRKLLYNPTMIKKLLYNFSSIDRKSRRRRHQCLDNSCNPYIGIYPLQFFDYYDVINVILTQPPLIISIKVKVEFHRKKSICNHSGKK
ncbi:hypothetical protein DERF_002906, partial [Dermatophagoides farinae]